MSKKKTSFKAFLEKCKTIGIVVSAKGPECPACHKPVSIHKLEYLGSVVLEARCRPKPDESEHQSFSA